MKKDLEHANTGVCARVYGYTSQIEFRRWLAGIRELGGNLARYQREKV